MRHFVVFFLFFFNSGKTFYPPKKMEMEKKTNRGGANRGGAKGENEWMKGRMDGFLKKNSLWGCRVPILSLSWRFQAFLEEKNVKKQTVLVPQKLLEKNGPNTLLNYQDAEATPPHKMGGGLWLTLYFKVHTIRRHKSFLRPPPTFSISWGTWVHKNMWRRRKRKKWLQKVFKCLQTFQ